MAQHRILVTGAGGFVGRMLMAAAATHDRADDIVLAGPGGDTLDIRDGKAVAGAIAAFRPTALIHLAAIASPRQASDNPGEAWAVNLMGTFNLADAVLKHAPEARFVFAGSSEAYGLGFLRGQGRPIGEDTPFEPGSPYGATKAAADIMLGQMERQGLQAVRFRPFNHTGPGQTAAYVVSAFARQIARIERGWQEPVMRVGNLSAKRDFLDVRDVVQAYLTAALGGNSAIGAFNVSTGKPVGIGAMLETLRGFSSQSIAVETDPALLRPSEIEIASGDPSRIRAAFGWEAHIPLEQTLLDVLDHWRGLADSRPELLRD